MLKKLLILIPVLIIFLLAMAFGAQNPQTVVVNLLVLQTEMAVASLLAIFLVAVFWLVFYYFAYRVYPGAIGITV